MTKIIVKNKLCRVLQNKRSIVQERLRDMHCYLRAASSETTCGSKTVLFISLKRQHERHGHLHMDAIQNMQRYLVHEGTQTDSKMVFKNCILCMFGISGSQPVSETNKIRSRGVLALAHSDDCRPSEASLRVRKYFVSFIDDKSRYR